MPKIPEYNSNIPIFHAEEGAATAWRQAGVHIEGQFNEAGQAISRGLQNYQNTLDDAAITSANADIGQHTVDMHQASADALKQADPSDPNFVKDFMDQQWEKGADTIRDKYSSASPKVQKAIDNALTSSKTTLGDRLLGEQSSLASQATEQNEKIRVNSLANVAVNDPASLPSLLQQNADQVGSLSSLPNAVKSAHLAETNAQIALQSGKALVDRVEGNPNTTQAQIDYVRQQIADPDGIYAKTMDAGERSGLLARLDKAKDTQASAQSEIAKINFPDVVKQGDMTGDFSRAKALATAYTGRTPNETQVEQYRMNKEISEHEAMYKQSDIATMGPEDAAKRLNQLQSDVTAAAPDTAGAARLAYQAAVQVLDARDKAYSKDPSGYIIQSDASTNALYQKFKTNPTPQTFAAYAAFSAGVQRRMYPGVVPSVITDEMRDEARGVVQSIGVDTAGPGNAGKSLALMAGKYGPYWSGIVSDLKREHVLSDEQYVAASMITNPRAQGTAEAVLAASSMSKDDRFNLHGISEAKAQAPAIRALAPLERSLANLPTAQRAQLVSGYTAALTHVLQTGGKADDATAATLASKMILGEYQFVGNGQTVRAPANVDGGAVGSGTERVLDDIGNHQIVVPKSSSGMGPTGQRANYVHQLQMTARWYTNDDGSGARLYDQDGHVILETRNGRTQPVELKWSDLEKAGRSKEVTPAQAQENIGTYEHASGGAH